MVCCLGTVQLNKKSVSIVWNYKEAADKAFMVNKVKHLHISHKENNKKLYLPSTT